VDLGRLLRLTRPAVRVSYDVAEAGGESLRELVGRFLDTAGLGGAGWRP
jgi:predicted GTPase